MNFRQRHLAKQSSQLGLNPRTASHRLNRTIFHSLLKETGRDSCVRCGASLSADTFSIEHIKEWLDSEDPIETFFDLNNIDFACKLCNIKFNRGRGDFRHGKKPFIKPISRETKPLLTEGVSLETKRQFCLAYISTLIKN